MDTPAPAASPPLVLVHGMWDTLRLFDRLKRELQQRRGPLLIPHLSHRFGVTPIEELAELLGFSMGGVIGRSWIQQLGGHRRTLTAQSWPSWPLAGITNLDTLGDVDCCSSSCHPDPDAVCLCCTATS